MLRDNTGKEYVQSTSRKIYPVYSKSTTSAHLALVRKIRDDTPP